MDKIDMKILSMLMNNCRESDRQIGKQLGISGGAVSSRIKKMENQGIIDFFILKIEPPVLGYGLFWIVVSGHDLDEILKQVKLVGEPFWAVPCVGGITACGIVVKENVEQKIELVKSLMKDVRVLSIFKSESPIMESNLTRTDLEIINQLLKNPREKVEKMAEAIGFSTKTIRRSIEKLQKNDGIQFTLIYDPAKIENFITHVILTWIDGDVKMIKKEFEEKFSESFMQIPFVTKNQIVLFFYSDDIFKMDDLTQKVRDIPGVKSADLFIPKKLNFPQEWVLDAIHTAKNSPTLHLVYQTN